MSYKNERYMKLVKDIDKTTSKKTDVTDKEAEEAFKTILAWIGEDPNREGLLETPKRVVKAFKEYFKGYHQDASADLLKTFGDVEGYDDMVVEKNITLESHCEHHMAPIIGVAHIAYIPKIKKKVGWFKLARTVEIFSKRLQTQERLTNADSQNTNDSSRCKRCCCNNRCCSSMYDHERCKKRKSYNSNKLLFRFFQRGS